MPSEQKPDRPATFAEILAPIHEATRLQGFTDEEIDRDIDEAIREYREERARLEAARERRDER